MGVLKNSDNTLVKYAFGFMFAGVLLVLAMLIASASSLANTSGIRSVSIGPLDLISLSKLPAEGGGSRASMQLSMSGMATFLFGLAIFGVCFGMIQKRTSRPSYR